MGQVTPHAADQKHSAETPQLQGTGHISLHDISRSHLAWSAPQFIVKAQPAERSLRAFLTEGGRALHQTCVHSAEHPPTALVYPANQD